MNPLIFDSKTGRNGGILRDQDQNIYRVFQVQGFDLYGESMGVAKITTLSATDYQEDVFCTIPAAFFDNLKGTHTYSFSKGLLALDFVTIEKYRK